MILFNFFVGLFVICTAVIGTRSKSRNTEYQTTTYDPRNITRVHVVFMNHLDVGYDGIDPTVGFAVNVINKYFDEYFPRAANLAILLRMLGYVERFVYTTHPWLLDLYFNCPGWLLNTGSLKCPNASMLALVEGAVRQGDITWHAAPMNMQYEFYTAGQLDLSLRISSRLDQRFNITRTHRVVSLRDVPGMTKAVIPVLLKNNISGISVGVNGGTPCPGVPPHPFLWKIDDTQPSGVVAFWHPGGYPNMPGFFPNVPGGMSVKDCHVTQRVTDFPEALCFAFRQDNMGPPEDIKEILNNFEIARGQFPAAVVNGSSLDEYVSALLAAKPFLSEFSMEVGDTWINGVNSDPLKTAHYRAFSRVLDKCLETGLCQEEDPRVVDAVRYLTKVPEHTWGLREISDGNKNISNAYFRKARAEGKYANWETSWEEQREFLSLAMMSLAGHPVVSLILQEFNLLEPALPDLTGYSQVSLVEQFTCSDGTIMGFGSDGALRELYDPYNKITWADNSHPIGQLVYNTYNEPTLQNSDRQKVTSQRTLHMKPEKGTKVEYLTTTWDISVNKIYKKTAPEETCDFWLELAPTNAEAIIDYGSPEMFYLHYVNRPKSGTNSTPGVDVEVEWFNKQPTRLTESVAWHVQPVIPQNSRWHLSKLGQMIDPMQVVANGSQYTHVVDSTVCLMEEEMGGLEFMTPDVALVMLGTESHPPGPFPQPYEPLQEAITTVGFDLFNNIWKTNYLFWYPFKSVDSAFKARFALNFVTM